MPPWPPVVPRRCLIFSLVGRDVRYSLLLSHQSEEGLDKIKNYFLLTKRLTCSKIVNLII